MDRNSKSSPCKECLSNGLYPPPLAEAEHLRFHLSERDSQIISLEAELIKCNTKISNLEEEIATWIEKYERLYDSHKRVQKLNQNLEEKLLQMVDKLKNEKSQLTKDIATLSLRLAESKNSYSILQKENERYKNDMNLAIQLLQCKPDKFVSQKLDNLPLDTQHRVSQFIMSKSKQVGAASYKSANENENNETSEYEFNISASLITKILAESIQDTVTKHCDSCNCSSKQTKPFANNETHNSVSTQTLLSGDVKKSLCLSCNEEIKHSCRAENAATNVNTIKDQYNPNMPRPVYVIPQPSLDSKIASTTEQEKVLTSREILNNIAFAAICKKYGKGAAVQNKMIEKVGEDQEKLKNASGVEIEPTVHHKLCDRTNLANANKMSSNIGEGHVDLDVKEFSPITSSMKNDSDDNVSFRKSSQGSMGGVSGTSSLAKSTSSANKSNTHVGPGPRFCSLRMQAGSKNILLDNAQSNVPPVLYKRQTKFNDDLVVKEGFDNFIDIEKNITGQSETAKSLLNVTNVTIINESGVIETNLVDVQVDNNNKDLGAILKGSPINPVLMNVSSSPLQPLKTLSFTDGSENGNNVAPTTKTDLYVAEVDNLLSKPNSEVAMNDTFSKENTALLNADSNTTNNFDKYEQQSKIKTKYNKSVDMKTLGRTKISKDTPSTGLGQAPLKTESETIAPNSSVVNVYPNLTQTHLKVNAGKIKVPEQSPSSLSSDDSAVLLQKQQLLRVAQWVENNLEQLNRNGVPAEEDIDFNSKTQERETLLMDENTQAAALNMPHPVSKFSQTDSNNLPYVKLSRKELLARDKAARERHLQSHGPGECEWCVLAKNMGAQPHAWYNGIPSSESEDDKDAEMNYNVKEFLNGDDWLPPKENGDGSRRTSSKTETDV